MKLNHRFMQAVQVIAVLLAGLGNTAFAFDMKAEQGFNKMAESTVKKPSDKPKDKGDTCKHHCKDDHHHTTTHAKKADDKPTFSVKMKNQ
jgi:hypothetical protein